MKFEVTILGCNAAIPAYDRHPTAQILNHNEHLFLIDCGEGTQMRMADFNIRRGKINQIFISHLHGDHIYGLIGLITSYQLLGRTNPLNIVSTKGLKKLIQAHLDSTGSRLDYELNITEIELSDADNGTLIPVFENKFLRVDAFTLEHRIDCLGYLFREKEKPFNIRKEKIEEYGLSIDEIKLLKSGMDIDRDGRKLSFKECTHPPKAPRSYAYSTDTIYLERNIDLLKGVDLLYHETTFIAEETERARQTYHTTTKQAATLAMKAGVKQLLIGHYSAKYYDLKPLLEECREVFPDTLLGIEGESYVI